MSGFSEQEKLFNELIMEWNNKINLVSRKKPDIFDLIENSGIYLNYIASGPARLIDIGTGGGFPGIVIKLHRPELQVILVDSIGKKIKAVKDIISRMSLIGIEATHSRAEELGKQMQYKNQFDYATARSVAPLDELIEMTVPLIKKRGSLITIKGNDVLKEIEATENLNYNISIELHDLPEERKAVVVKFN